MRTYILRKDLPDAKAGAEFKLGKDTDAYYLTSDKTGTGYNCYSYPKEFVEKNNEWFKEKEEKPTITHWYNNGIDAGNLCNPSA